MRQFKNEIRISQIENRIQENERRLSVDARRINTLENLSKDKGDDDYLMVNVTNKKNNFSGVTPRKKGQDSDRENART